MRKGIVVKQTTAYFRFGITSGFLHVALNNDGTEQFFASLKSVLALKQEARKGHKLRKASKHLGLNFNERFRATVMAQLRSVPNQCQKMNVVFSLLLRCTNILRYCLNSLAIKLVICYL